MSEINPSANTIAQNSQFGSPTTVPVGPSSHTPPSYDLPTLIKGGLNIFTAIKSGNDYQQALQNAKSTLADMPEGSFVRIRQVFQTNGNRDFSATIYKGTFSEASTDFSNVNRATLGDPRDTVVETIVFKSDTLTPPVTLVEDSNSKSGRTASFSRYCDWLGVSSKKPFCEDCLDSNLREVY